jgi:hypothetical protein
MNKTYQPFIIEKAEEILEILKEDVTYTEFSKNRMCDMLTEKFISGDLSSEDPVYGLFNEDELLDFISETALHDDLDALIEQGHVDYFEDENKETCYFLTEEGKRYMSGLIQKG